ncbi:MAG TPA: hypothetical protein VF501_06830, partial [Thiobacillus sp.]
DAALFVGSGKADEIAARVAAADADVVIFNHELSPAQERNLERRLHCQLIRIAGMQQGRPDAPTKPTGFTASITTPRSADARLPVPG